MRFIKNHKWISVFLILLSIYLYANYTREGIFERNTNTKEKHYINELYKSDDRIYKEILEEKEKDIYDLLLETIKSYETSIQLDNKKYECEKNYAQCESYLRNVTEALWVDHPELLNFASLGWIYQDNQFDVKIYYAFKNPIKEAIGVLRIERIISDIQEETKNMTDKEKIIYVYDWMGEHNTYDNLFTYTSKNQSIYNVFLKKNAVCAGFAKASQIILSHLGIKSYIISGEDHMWNVIEYKKKYYYFDSTVSVSMKKTHPHHYDGLIQTTMKNRSLYYPEWYPKTEEENMFESME